MSPNPKLKSFARQRGFLIPLSLFIVVVMGLFALVISRTSTQTNTASIQELLSVQAFYAAESGTQRGMQNLFFPDASLRQAVDARCAALNQSYNFTGVPGLAHCTAQTSCVCVYGNNTVCSPGTAANYSSTTSVAESFYTLTTIGSCGQLRYNAVRTIQAGAFLKQE